MDYTLSLSLPAPELITLSGQCADKLIRLGDGDAALLYLYILQTRGLATVAEAAETLGHSPEEIEIALARLGKLGLVRCEDILPEQREAPPAATVEDIRRELENGTAFPELVLEMESMFGKLSSERDLEKLFNVYNGLKLPIDVILQLAAHCVEDARARGRSPSMRQLEKEAYQWERAGVFTLDKAEQYMQEQNERRSATEEIRRVLQIRGRALSPSERKYISGWLSLGFPPGAIELAYDRTVLKTGRLAWSYMDSIINSWHGKGLHTPEEIINRDKPAPSQTAASGTAPPDARELERMSRLLDSIREG
jgi:hypothetical protein